MSQKYGRVEISKKLSQESSNKKTKKESNIYYFKNVEYSRADLEDIDIKNFNKILEYKKLLYCKNFVSPEYRFKKYTNFDESKLIQTVYVFIYI
jgi:hypothetical protein